MEKLFIPPTDTTPYVALVADDGIMEIRGVCYTEDALDFFQPIFDWLDAYGNSPFDPTILNLELPYFNTSTAKCIYDLLMRFSNLYEQGINVVINWYYDVEDEGLREEIDNFAEISAVPFNILEVTG